MNCDSSRLSRLVSLEEVEFDADIAGLGVLIAFVATSATVIIVLAFAFFTLSVPSRLLNTGDAVMAAGIRRMYHGLRSLFPKLKIVKVVDTRNERVTAYKAFLLSTSDQLLVSQVAILIAAFIIYGDITIYSVNVVVALGTLASTVHLGCFPFYLDRLVDNSVAKLVRVLVMVSGSGMLVFMLIAQLSYSWDMESHVYFACAVKDFNMDGNTILNSFTSLFVPLTVLYGTYETVQLLYTKGPRDIESAGRHSQGRQITSPPGVGNESNITAGSDIEMQPMRVVPTRLQQFLDGNSTLNLSTIEKEALILHIEFNLTNDTAPSGQLKKTYHQLQLELSNQSPKITTVKDIWRKVREGERNTLLDHWLQLKALDLLKSESTSRSQLWRPIIWIVERWSFHQCRGSFVWRLFWLWSGNIYGITSIFTFRVTTTGMSGDPDHWGFGQIVPLALLALPIFAAMGSHAGKYSDNRDSNSCLSNLIRDYKRQVKTIKENLAKPAAASLLVAADQQPAQDAVSPDDLEAIRFVIQTFQQRAEYLGHPYLYNWVRGVSLDRSSSLQMGTGLQAIIMFTIATILGVFMAKGTATMNIAMITVLAIILVRRIVDLVLLAKATTGMPEILEILYGGTLDKTLRAGDQAERMAGAQMVGEANGEEEEE
ncbi:hypothetical protein HYE68_011103 [Fusarium pseudograminearum]|nr:hypothetical protein HYE68_011103 [Fusarium pseudograminearum]